MKTITFGEIMLRLSTPGYQRFVQAQNFDVTYGGGDFAAFLREPPGGREGMGQGSGFIIHLVSHQSAMTVDLSILAI